MSSSPISIADTFAALRAAGRIALMPFVPAGYPDLATTEALLPALQRGGASLIEIGFPFSDPIADGPVIQEAFAHTLANKVRLDQIFDSVARARSSVSIPLVAMVSYSIVFRTGVDRFVARAAAAGFNGLIIPDLPPPEAQPVCRIVRAAGLDTVLLVAPTTNAVRRGEIAGLCSGFVYYLSVAGVTGERSSLPPDLEANVRQMKQLAKCPVCVGFGVSNSSHVKQLSRFADGAIVGSAVVRQLQRHRDQPPAAIAAAMENYCRDLLS